MTRSFWDVSGVPANNKLKLCGERDYLLRERDGEGGGRAREMVEVQSQSPMSIFHRWRHF